MAIVAMLAAILLPLAPGGTSHPRLEAYAVQLATLLKTDRNAAMLLRIGVSAQIDARGRLVRSGAGGQTVQLPDDIAFDALLPERCNGQPALSTISFFANGMSCGGVLRLLRFGSGFEIRVNWLTGEVEIVPRNTI
jgi:general secretion pathway protein H